MTASPMNFSTVPPWRSSSARTRSWYGRRIASTSSGSSDSARLVKPTRSQKTTVTTLRSRRAVPPAMGQRVWRRRRVVSSDGAHQGLVGSRCRRGRRHGRGRLGAHAAPPRVRIAVHGSLPVSRGEDAVVLRQPGGEALLLLRLRQGRGRHLVRARDGEPRLRRRGGVAGGAVPRPDRGRAGVAAGRGGARRRRERLHAVLDQSATYFERLLWDSDAGGLRRANTSPVAVSARRSRRSSGSVSPRQGPRRQGEGARLHARRAAVRGPRHHAWNGLLPTAPDVPARRCAWSRRRLPGEEAARRRSPARQVRELARGRPLPQERDPVRAPPREDRDRQAGLRSGRRGEHRRHRAPSGRVRARRGVDGDGAHRPAASRARRG